MEKDGVIIGGIYLHPDGIQYRVNKIILDATGYEKTNDLKKKVEYTQLQDGTMCKKGTEYVKDLQDFLRFFTIVSKG